MILITGASGYIGSHLCHELYNRGIKFIGVDIDIHKNLIPGVQYHKCDCRDTEDLKKIFYKSHPKIVIHLAAYKSINQSILMPLDYFHNNINSTINILLMCRKYNCERIIFSSTCAVYGSAQSPVAETSPIAPENPYAQSKAICEEIIKASTVPFTILRYFNPVGEHHGLRDFAQDSINNNLQDCENLTIYGGDYDTPDGTPIRDFIEIKKLVGCHLKALDTPANEIFNIGQGRGQSIIQLCEDLSMPYTIGPRRAGDAPSIWADTTKWEAAIKT